MMREANNDAHDCVPQPEVRSHQSTQNQHRKSFFRPKIRKSIPQRPTSEQFYASPEHPCIHQDQRSDDEHGENEHKARDHHVILCNTACFAMWGSYTLGVST